MDTGGKKAEYSYDGNGVRRSKTTEGKTTGYYMAGDQVINETENGALSASNIIAGGVIGRITGGTSYMMLKNDHGDVVGLTANGEVKADYTYSAYGELIAGESNGINNPIRYAGEYTDEESGLIYLRARYYDPGLGRFISEDTHWNSSNMIYGDNPDENNPVPNMSAIMQSSNLFVYCSNNPVMLVDPSGNVSLTTLTEAQRLGERYGYGTVIKVNDAQSRARKNSDNWAGRVGAGTWDNEFDAMRHFQWNAVMTREIGYQVAIVASYNHEIYSLNDLGFLRNWDGNFGGVVRTRMNQSTLMDLWNNVMGRQFAADPRFSHMNYDELFLYAANNGYLILNAEKTYEILGITDYIQTSDWTVGVDLDLRNGTITVMKEGLPDITLRIGKPI